MNAIRNGFNNAPGAAFKLLFSKPLFKKLHKLTGGLNSILETLSKESINVEYMYAFIQSSGKNAVIIFRFDNTDRAIEILSGAGYKVLSGEKVYSL